MDTTAPLVTEVKSTTGDGYYPQGAIIDILIDFAELVSVPSGTPSLTLENMANPNFAVNYSSGSGSDTLTFQYAVGASQNSTALDYVDTNSLTANGSGIEDRAANGLTFAGALAAKDR